METHFKNLLVYYFIANLVVNAFEPFPTIYSYFHESCDPKWVGLQFNATGEIWAVFVVVPMYLYRVNSSLCCGVMYRLNSGKHHHHLLFHFQVCRLTWKANCSVSI